jgi:S-adenosylmethionine:tRNA ribosyltransferase-isomerase
LKVKMNLSDFDYQLPPERIAQTPAEPRDSARLLVLHRAQQTLEHRIFRELGDYLRAGDVLVVNKTRVIPARLPAIKAETGGKAELLLLRPLDEVRWLVLIGGRRAVEGTHFILERNGTRLEAVVEAVHEEAQRVVRFSEPLGDKLALLGETPLPPYITQALSDPERYQTVYSQVEGSAAAPTAGLHFTPDLLIGLSRRGVKIAYCVLHVGLDTFAPVREDNIHAHKIHREKALLSPEDAKIINEAKLAGGRIVAVGTTSCRTLETAAIRSLAFGTPENDPTSVMATLAVLPTGICPWRPVVAFEEETDLYITPGYCFRAVDALITNFHLPKTTLLMMISAFAGHEFTLSAYQKAIEAEYRFYSFGDAMLIL